MMKTAVKQLTHVNTKGYLVPLTSDEHPYIKGKIIFMTFYYAIINFINPTDPAAAAEILRDKDEFLSLEYFVKNEETGELDYVQIWGEAATEEERAEFITKVKGEEFFDNIMWARETAKWEQEK